MRLLVNNSHDPAFNLALEEILAAEYCCEFFMLWRNAPSVIVGRNQNTMAEIDSDKVREANIHVVRRITGGGAVYHDLGNLNYTIACSGRRMEASSFAGCAKMVIDVLRKMGVNAEFSGRNDILVDNRKISGSAKSLLRERTLFHGTLLFDVDLEVLGKVLSPDPDKIRSKGIKSVRSRVMNLKELFPTWSADDFCRNFQRGIEAELKVSEPDEIPPEFICRAELLAEEKYRTRDWNYGIAYPFEFNRRKRFPGGGVQISAGIKHNRIEELSIKGDFFGDEPIEMVAAMLSGCQFSPEAVAERLCGTDLSRFIQGVSIEEFSSLFE